jgi:hypothetical protein
MVSRFQINTGKRKFTLIIHTDGERFIDDYVNQNAINEQAEMVTELVNNVFKEVGEMMVGVNQFLLIVINKFKYLQPQKDEVDRFGVNPKALTFAKHASIVTEFLCDLYQRIENIFHNILFYDSENGKIFFYDLVCNIKPDTQESRLCDQMIKYYGFGERVDINDLAGKVYSKDSPDSTDEGHLRGAIKSINKKTKECFGFNLFAIKQGVFIVYPTVSSLSAVAPDRMNKKQ